MNVLQIVGNFLHGVEKDVVHTIEHFQSPEAQQKVQAVLHDIANAIPVALTIAQSIDALVSNKTLEEFEALAAKYQRHVTPEIINDPVAQGQLLEAAALQEVKALAPQLGNSKINAAVNLVVSLLHA